MDALIAPIFTPLRQILHPKGDIFHALKSGETDFQGFGEAYFTTIQPGETKGWKKHTRMVMNLIVPVGEVRFDLRDGAGQAHSFFIGRSNYGRLHVQPGWWTAFTGIGDGLNLILNVASIPHDPDEAVNAPLEQFPLGGA
jgi:dTDP-4-dehydrorhamnose 3,5-epimerase